MNAELVVHTTCCHRNRVYRNTVVSAWSFGGVVETTIRCADSPACEEAERAYVARVVRPFLARLQN